MLCALNLTLWAWPTHIRHSFADGQTQLGALPENSEPGAVPLFCPLAPKALSEKCVPDRSPQWEVQDVTKNAVASSRIISLAQPKIRKDLNEGYNPYYISPASLVAQASPRIFELATPKYITKKV